MKRFLVGLFALLLVLAAVLLYRTFTFLPAPAVAVAVASNAPPETKAEAGVDGNVIAEHLAAAVRFATISQQPPLKADQSQFDGFIAWLAETYPEVHAALKLERLGGNTLLYTWTGRNEAARPVLLTGHYDVVPVIPGSEAQWKHPPFSGQIADGFVWGRGTLDDKSAIVSMMEAVTLLLKQGFTPTQTVYLSFGHDEEIGGLEGAAAVATKLKQDKVRLAWSLDEGSFVLDGLVPGLQQPAASINIAEKGVLTVNLVARGAGGHSSMPPRETAVGVLAEAITRLQRAPVPGGLDGLAGDAFDTLARNMPFEKRLLFANKWLFGPLIESELAKSPSSNAMLRTTTAPTMLSGSIKENVLPIEAVGTINFRIHPRDTIEGVVDYVKKTINDERITVNILGTPTPASPTASTASSGFQAIASSVRRIYGDAIVFAGLTIAATDSRHYGQVSDNAFRFNPMLITGADLTGFHGTNERISVANLERATQFYIQLLRMPAE